MKVKTSELTGAALDWAVATITKAAIISLDGTHLRDIKGRIYSPSTDWSQGGPIVERERIRTRFESECYWYFTTPTDTWLANYEGVGEWLGLTPLIAAMRCYVASKLGDEVDVPEELLA